MELSGKVVVVTGASMGIGEAIAIAFGIGNLALTAGVLSLINWRSRDFNLKQQRRKIRLVDLPQGRPAVAPNVTADV